MTDSGCQDNSIHEMDNTTTGASSTSCLALATPRLSKWWALGRQFFSAVPISTNSGQRVRQGRGRSGGCTDAAKRAMASTSMASVVANSSDVLAKSRAWRRLITITGRQAAGCPDVTYESKCRVTSTAISMRARALRWSMKWWGQVRMFPYARA